MALNVGAKEDIGLPLYWDILDASAGIALDIGGSVIKIAYIHKDDWVEPANRKKDSKGKLSLINFPKEEIDEAIKFIKNNAKIMRKSPAVEVNFYCTGIGGTQFSKLFAEQLNAININLTEMDCFVHCLFHLLETLPRREIFHTFNMQAYQRAMLDANSNFKIFTKLKNVTSAKNDQSLSDVADFQHIQAAIDPNSHKRIAESEASLFPCLLVICGSASSFNLVNADGSFMILDSTGSCGGRTFQGLGSLLTNTKNFSELISLCGSGSALNVSTTNKSIASTMEKGDKDDFYNIFLNDDEQPEKTIFSFGKASGKTIGDFKKEDLAKCLLETIAIDLVHLATYISSGIKVKHVLFCGGLVNHPLPRELITEEWLKRDFMRSIMDPTKDGFTQIHFLKYSQSLGAIGALMNHKHQWSKSKNTPMTALPPSPAATMLGYKQSIGI